MMKRFAVMLAVLAAALCLGARQISAADNPRPLKKTKAQIKAEREAKADAEAEAKAEEAYDKAYPPDTRPLEVQIREMQLKYGPEWEAAKKYEDEDQRLYVRPAPAGFQPEAAARKVKLTLIPEKTKYKVGEKIRYRLELQNIGRVEFDFFEYRSFIKTGTITSEFKFFLVMKNGKEIELDHLYLRDDPGSNAYDPPGFSRLTDDQKAAWVKRVQIESNVAYQLSVHLKPGETLYTRPWGISENQAWLSRALQEEDYLAKIRREPGDFRDLVLDHLYKNSIHEPPLIPGTYRIKAVFEDSAPTPPEKKNIRRMMKRGKNREDAERSEEERYQNEQRKYLGRAESNIIEMEVTP